MTVNPFTYSPPYHPIPYSAPPPGFSLNTFTLENLLKSYDRSVPIRLYLIFCSGFAVFVGHKRVSDLELILTNGIKQLVNPVVINDDFTLRDHLQHLLNLCHTLEPDIRAEISLRGGHRGNRRLNHHQTRRSLLRSHGRTRARTCIRSSRKTHRKTRTHRIAANTCTRFPT